MRKEDYKELNEIKYKVIDEKHNVLDNSDLVINNNQENLSDEEMLDNYIDTSIISYKDMPEFLRHDLIAYLKTINNPKEKNDIDLYENEIYGSVNAAMVDDLITVTQAAYLRKRFLEI